MVHIARAVTSAVAALLLAGIGVSPAHADFSSCVAGIRSQALNQGISEAVFDRAMGGVKPDMDVIKAMNNQPEFKTPIWDYLGALVDEERVAEGRALLARHASTLAAAESRFGVDRHTIVAVWGVESNYGQVRGKWSLPQALSTAACLGSRRNAFFKGELLATLKIIQRGDLRQEQLIGSWAGAFGHTQFIPTTYLRLAVDGDGDGRRDLVDSIPDALHSTANFMAKAGWNTGASWGYEVRVPSGYGGPSGRTSRSPVSAWASRGLTKVDGSALTGGGNAGLVYPARGGPGFLVFRNYDAAFSYNGADSYALAISLLADRLRGRQGVQQRWPTDDPPTSRAERREMQRLLIAKGYDVGEPDGAVGAKTRAAIEAIEAQIGLPRTGRPGGKVLQALRGR
jgi:lytic murein transglycosylase